MAPLEGFKLLIGEVESGVRARELFRLEPSGLGSSLRETTLIVGVPFGASRRDVVTTTLTEFKIVTATPAFVLGTQLHGDPDFTSVIRPGHAQAPNTNPGPILITTEVSPRPSDPPPPAPDRPLQTQPAQTRTITAQPIKTNSPDNDSPLHDQNPGPSAVRADSAHDIGDASKAFTSVEITTTIVTDGVFTTDTTRTLPNGSVETLTLLTSGTRTLTTTTEVTSQIATVSSNSGPPKAIIRGVIGATVIVILALVAFCILRHKRRRQRIILSMAEAPESFGLHVRSISGVSETRHVPVTMAPVGNLSRDNSPTKIDRPMVPAESGDTGLKSAIRKKSVPYLDDPLKDSSSMGSSLVASMGSFLTASIASSGGSSFLGSQARSTTDDPYLRGLLVDLRPNSSQPPRVSTAASSAIAIDIETDPFTDPKNPFADPEKPSSDPFSSPKDRHLSTRSGLSYASLTPSQIDQHMESAPDLIGRHLSVKSGLSYASLTPSQVQRRVDYVSSGSSSDTSSDIRLSVRSGTPITSTTSAHTIKGNETIVFHILKGKRKPFERAEVAPVSIGAHPFTGSDRTNSPAKYTDTRELPTTSSPHSSSPSFFRNISHENGNNKSSEEPKDPFCDPEPLDEPHLPETGVPEVGNALDHLRILTTH